MPLFSASSPFDADVEKVTSEKNTKEDWTLLMDICDRVQATTTGPKDVLISIKKRLNHHIPHVNMQALTLLDVCVNNCGRAFHLEVSSRDFTEELKRVLRKCHAKVGEKIREMIKKWALNDFKSDPALNLIPSLYNSLRAEGAYGDEPHTHTHTHTTPATHTSPAKVDTAKEDNDLKKAIELSLKEAEKKKSVTTGSLYPSATSGGGGGGGSTLSAMVAGSPTSPTKEPFQTRALYDFEAAEDNELTFKTGEIVFVTDDSDQNWWKGYNQRGDGLFPANFVTRDIDAPLEEPMAVKSERKVAFNDEVEVKTISTLAAPVTVNEAQIDRVLDLLSDADPTGERSDSQELLDNEEVVRAMGPLLDAEMEKIDKKTNELSSLNSQLVEALNLYHQLMKEPMPSMPPPAATLPQGYMAPPVYPGMQQPPATYPGVPQPAVYGAGSHGQVPMSMYGPPEQPMYQAAIPYSAPGQPYQGQTYVSQPVQSVGYQPVVTQQPPQPPPQQQQQQPPVYQMAGQQPTMMYASAQQPPQQQQYQQPLL